MSSEDDTTEREDDYEDRPPSLREALEVFAKMSAMNPPAGMILGDWIVAVTGARAALKAALPTADRTR